jgi:hypothetical protein
MGIRFGVDAFLELIPGVGDMIVLMLSLYIVSVGLKMKIPTSAVAEMIVNIGIAVGMGFVPLIGDAAYIFYRPNVRNLKILEKYTSNTYPISGKLLAK